MVWNEKLKREIPEGWEYGTLSDIANITMGQSPKGCSYNMQGAVNRKSALQEKIEQIRAGAVKKTDLGVNVNKGVIHGKSGKYHVVEKEKKFEEAGVKRKKRNYVLYESKLGTEKEKNLQKIAEPPKPKPKPAPVARPRVEEKIIQKKKRLEYLDNYQYKETKNVKNPRRISIVTHQRLGDIVGGVYEEHTFQRMTVNDTGRGPKLYSQETSTTTSRRGPQGQPLKSTQRTITASRTVPAMPKEYRKEIKQYSSNTNKRNAPQMRTSKTTTTTTKTTTTRSSSKPVNVRGTTTTTTTTKTVVRGQSASGLRGRKQ
jgi:hypothetical protein